jgi:hypothetical protein
MLASAVVLSRSVTGIHVLWITSLRVRGLSAGMGSVMVRATQVGYSLSFASMAFATLSSFFPKLRVGMRYTLGSSRT